LKRFAGNAAKTTQQKKAAPAKLRKIQRAQGNAPTFNLRGELHRISGVDLTRIDGVDVMVAQTIVSEVGLDMG
jgi:transposase